MSYVELKLGLSLDTWLVFDVRELIYTLYNYKINLVNTFERHLIDDIDASATFDINPSNHGF